MNTLNTASVLIWTGCLVLPFLAIWSLVISGACRLARVRPPGFFHGMGIAFCLLLMNLMAGVAVAVVFGAATGAPILSGNVSRVQLETLIRDSSPFNAVVGPLVSAGVFTVMLEECGFLRGLLVWLLQFVVIVLFLLVIAGISYALNLR
jgi:hypothetical protein